MSWQTAHFVWPPGAELLRASMAPLLAKIPAAQARSLSAIRRLQPFVTFAPHSLSQEAQAFAAYRAELDALMARGQVLCVHPYQQEVGEQSEGKPFLSPRKAVKVLANKLRDCHDDNQPHGWLHAMAWMLTAESLDGFARATRNLYGVTGLPELGMVCRRVADEQSLHMSKLTLPPTIIQPRLPPAADVNLKPWRQTHHLLGAQIAHMESLAADRKSLVEKLTRLASKRERQLQHWQQQLDALKQSEGTMFKLRYQGEAKIIATALEQNAVPSQNGPHTFVALFLSPAPMPFLTELFQ